MPDWLLVLLAIALVASVLELAVLSATEVVESRVLVSGFLAFFVLSLIAGAGLLPATPSGDEAIAELQSVANAEGDSR